MALDAVAPDGRLVRVTGMAHYGSLIKQTTQGNLIVEPRTWYLFALFPELDTASRTVRVLVRTQREPEARVSFEVMTIEGRVAVPSSLTVPPSTEAMLSKRSDYYFAEDVVVLEPVRILSEDGVWEEP